MSALSALLLLVMLLLAAMVQAGEPGPTTNNCPAGQTQQEITTPGLTDGESPSTAILVQQPANTLTLWPISPELVPAYEGNITEFVGAFGSCDQDGCATGRLAIGLYHFHAVGYEVPSEAGKMHLISYSNPITYHPEDGGSGQNVRARYKSAKAHPQQSANQVVPQASPGNAATGYYIGIVSTVPYGIFTAGGFTGEPYYLTKAYTPKAHSAKLLPPNFPGDTLTQDYADNEAALGFFFCSGSS